MIWYHLPHRGTNLVKRKGTKMLIKFDAEQPMVDMLKMHSGQRVASKAYKQCAEDAPGLAEEVRRLRRQIEDLKQVIAVQKQTINRAADAARALLDHVAQGDLING
jgi:hypothetical protein